ncbi:guanine deaminase [Oceanithermus desulfurans]|uniref:Guanine deaminase n=2 Tax=Oceanithermus desulfurans TaxID=227924 RepID=A0A511RJA0_9DEIN|nr:guanine deaminase [Oceanithermus desulfurans]MBB6029582.1 guanine deaminase [Oceanithermus desulfurans]GEM89723.1 putative guanine deaminase [Oceanithermus desulfurans NBRC 100063]
MILRASLLHAVGEGPLEARLEGWSDGGLFIESGRIADVGPFAEVRARHPEAPLRRLEGGLLLPGFVDAHVHFPQTGVIGALGLDLLDWLERVTLPAEARFADEAYARREAQTFLRALVRSGTTRALVFGSHFAPAQAALFEEAAALGFPLTSGLATGDRNLRPELHTTPERAYAENRALIERYHGQGGLRYAVTPRFALAASEALLEVSGALLREHPDLHLQTHLNENPREIEAVARLFPAAHDYLDVYDRFGLLGPRAVFAHDVHPNPRELERLAASAAWVAHCPSSNAFLGSGLFPMRAHLEAGVRFALGSDVGAGTRFSLLGEAMDAYKTQRLRADGVNLPAAALLWLATRAGAAALGQPGEAGGLEPDRSADLVWLRPPPGSTLEAVLAQADGPDRALGAAFALAREDAVAAVWIRGRLVYQRGMLQAE